MGKRKHDDDDEPPRHAAARRGDEGGIRALVAAGADVNEMAPLLDAPDGAFPRAVTPLMVAAGSGEGATAETLRLLCSLGADPNATRDHGFTVLMTAASSLSRDVEVLRLLVDHGADPHAVSEYGGNVLHAAVDVNGAEANSPDCVRAILGYLHGLGVSLEQRDRQGMTPMERAGWKGTAVENKVLAELCRHRRP